MRFSTLAWLGLVAVGGCNGGGATGGDGGPIGSTLRAAVACPAGTSLGAPARGSSRGDPSWPQYQHSSANQALSTARIPDAPHKVWSTPIDKDIAYQTPALGGGKLFYRPYAKAMLALDAATGAIVWDKPLPGGGKYGGAAYADGVVITTTGQDDQFQDAVVGLDENNGNVLWTGPKHKTLWTSLKVDAGTVYYLGSDDGFAGPIMALDAKTGAERWRSSDRCVTGPAVSGGRVYCAGATALFALDAATGVRVWQAAAIATAALSSPAVVDGRVFYVGAGLHAHDAATGAPLWSNSFERANLSINGGTQIETTPSVAYGKVYVIGAAGLDAYDAATGCIFWHSPEGLPGSTVAIADGRIIVPGGAVLDSETGAVLWQATAFTDRLAGNAIATDGHFYGFVQGATQAIVGFGGTVPGEPPIY